MGSDSFDALRQAVLREPLQREIKYRILSMCRERRRLEEIEEEIARMPQFELAAQNQYRMVETLEMAGGLKRIELDEEGNELTPESKEGLSEDEASDMVACVFFETTPEGEAFVRENSPERRFRRLLEEEPSRSERFCALLEYCSVDTRSLAEIIGFLRDKSHPWAGGDVPDVHPSLFVDRLERSGLIEWQDGWKATKEGEACLNARAEMSAR